MAMDIEAVLIAYLYEQLGVETYADVPKTRPETFITVERTGGGDDRRIRRNNPTVAVQSWAPSRLEASRLSQKVEEALASVACDEPGICSVDITAAYNWPAEKGEPRYQVVCDLVTR